GDPGALAFDLFGHGAAERDGFGHSAQNVVGGEIGVGVESFVEAAVDRFFDFSAAKTVTRGGEAGHVEVCGSASASSDVDAENFFAFFRAREVYVKNLVEAAFAQQFGREIGNIIGGGDDEDRFFLF